MTETKSIVVERLIPHAAEKIWRALTVPELIAEWLMQNDFVAQEGHRFTFRATPVPGWSGVTNCVGAEGRGAAPAGLQLGRRNGIRQRSANRGDLVAHARGRCDPSADGAVRDSGPPTNVDLSAWETVGRASSSGLSRLPQNKADPRQPTVGAADTRQTRKPGCAASGPGKTRPDETRQKEKGHASKN